MHDNVVVVDDDDHDDQTNIIIALRNSMNISYGFVLEYFFFKHGLIINHVSHYLIVIWGIYLILGHTNVFGYFTILNKTFKIQPFSDDSPNPPKSSCGDST